MAYDILTDQPPPGGYKTPEKYPFSSMGIGQSFVMPPGEEYRITQAAYRWRERHMPWAFRVGTDEDGSARLWRIADKNKRIKGSSLCL
jgi:hypothetical protein